MSQDSQPAPRIADVPLVGRRWRGIPETPAHLRPKTFMVGHRIQVGDTVVEVTHINGNTVTAKVVEP